MVRTDTYLVNNVPGMTRTAMQRPPLQADTFVFRNNDSSRERFKYVRVRLHDIRIFRRAFFRVQKRDYRISRIKKSQTFFKFRRLIILYLLLLADVHEDY
jgi:hypothetical protein